MTCGEAVATRNEWNSQRSPLKGPGAWGAQPMITITRNPQWKSWFQVTFPVTGESVKPSTSVSNTWDRRVKIIDEWLLFYFSITMIGKFPLPRMIFLNHAHLQYDFSISERGAHSHLEMPTESQETFYVVVPQNKGVLFFKSTIGTFSLEAPCKRVFHD